MIGKYLKKPVVVFLGSIPNHSDRFKRGHEKHYIRAVLSLAVFLIISFPCLADEAGALTKKFEGFRGTIYRCPAGAKTIGFGFNLDEGDVRRMVPLDVLSGKRPLYLDEADEIFRDLYDKARKEAMEFLGYHTFSELDPAKQEVVIDMAYNLGAPRLAQFKKFRKAVVRGDHKLAAYELKNSLWYKQTGRRARHHVEVFSR